MSRTSTNQPSTPPDRTKTVCFGRYTEFGINQNNDEEFDDGWRAATKKVSNIAAITVISKSQEKSFQ